MQFPFSVLLLSVLSHSTFGGFLHRTPLLESPSFLTEELPPLPTPTGYVAEPLVSTLSHSEPTIRQIPLPVHAALRLPLPHTQAIFRNEEPILRTAALPVAYAHGPYVKPLPEPTIPATLPLPAALPEQITRPALPAAHLEPITRPALPAALLEPITRPALPAALLDPISRPALPAALLEPIARPALPALPFFPSFHAPQLFPRPIFTTPHNNAIPFPIRPFTYPYPLSHNLPFAQAYPLAIEKNVLVAQPFPVVKYIPVEKKVNVPYKIEVPKYIHVEKKVHVPFRVEVPIEKTVQVPYKVEVPKYIEKQIPYKVEVLKYIDRPAGWEAQIRQENEEEEERPIIEERKIMEMERTTREPERPTPPPQST